ncbi:MAG: hypothetical protein LBI38_05025 [Oscillospiraceae bacterium]|nr:hypothetical protein [Oscillospiraceae bacterium]
MNYILSWTTDDRRYAQLSDERQNDPYEKGKDDFYCDKLVKNKNGSVSVEDAIRGVTLSALEMYGKDTDVTFKDLAPFAEDLKSGKTVDLYDCIS